MSRHDEPHRDAKRSEAPADATLGYERRSKSVPRADKGSRLAPAKSPHTPKTVDYRALLVRPTLRVKEVADIFGVGERAIRDRCRRGELHAIRVGRAMRITTCSVQALLGSHG